MIYKAGTIVLFEEGDYSDFGYCGQVVTLCDLDLPAAIQAWKEGLGVDKDGRPIADSYKHGPSAFVAHLIKTQQCAPLECQTVHIGGYGRVGLEDD